MEQQAIQSTQHATGPLTGLLAAVRPMVAMTYAEALEKEHHGMKFMFCQCDVLNPCWDNRPDDVLGKHWGGGEACPECNLRAVIASQAEVQLHSLRTPVFSTMPGQADAHLRALLRYTENFYATAISHGMKAGPTANAVAHVERAGKALHQLVHALARMLSAEKERGAPVTARGVEKAYDGQVDGSGA